MKAAGLFGFCSGGGLCYVGEGGELLVEVLAEEVEAGGDFVEGFVAAAFAGAEFARGEVVHAVKEVGDVRALAVERFQDVGAADVHTVETAFEEGPRLAAPLGCGEVRPEEVLRFGGYGVGVHQQLIQSLSSEQGRMPREMVL